MDALLLAAGFGTRLRPLTLLLPKALLPIYGIPLLDYHLARLFGEGLVDRVIVNGHHLADRVRAHIDRRADRKRIGFSFEPEILGTGGAIAKVGDELNGDPFLVLNADALFPAPITEAVDFHRRHDFLATMVLARCPVRPNVLVEEDRVASIPPNEGDPGAFTFTGFHIVSRDLLRLLPRRIFHDISDTYRSIMAGGRLGAFVWSTGGEVPFLDIGTPEAYLEAHRVCAGVGADRFRLCPPAAERIIPAAGYGFIDRSAVIGKGSRIEQSVVLAEAEVAANSRIRRSIIGPGAAATGEICDCVVTRDGTRPIRS